MPASLASAISKVFSLKDPPWFFISICIEQINLDSFVSDGRRLSHCI